MSRKYRVRPHEWSSYPPTGRRQVRTGGLRQRHWAVLAVLAEHGVLHTGQVTALLFGSRPAAVRHLSTLVDAGLVWRFVDGHDSRHLAFYELSLEGQETVAARLRAAGRPVPLALGSQSQATFVVNDFFVALAEVERQGHGQLFRWRRALDATAWLRRLGVPDVAPQAYGVWIQDDRAVRFLLHVDDGRADPLFDDPPPPPGKALDGYRLAPTGVPVTAVLMICADDREREAHADRTIAELPVTVAVTTLARLYAAVSPAGAIWTRADDPGRTVRLIDLADS